MLPLLRHLLDASYLYAQNARPVRHWTMAQVGLFLALGLGTLVAWRRRRHLAGSSGPPLAPRVAAWACLAALALFIVHLQVAGPLSARVWYVSAIAVALVALVAQCASRRISGQHLRLPARSLSCQLGLNDLPMSWPWQMVWALVHLGGLWTLCVGEGSGWWLAVVAVACLIVAAWARAHVCGWRWFKFLPIEVLTPFLLPYGTVLLRRFVMGVLGVDVALYQAFPYPDPWSPWFDLRVTLPMGVAGLVLTTGALVWRSVRSLHVAWLPAQRALGLAALLFGLVWCVATAATHLSHGVTGSDPYCYLQMAVDLAERGTALHDFPLASLAREAGLPLWPIVHVGYHPPIVGTLVPTVWPIGWPVLLAPLFLVWGEGGILWAAPLCTVLAGILTWRLARLLWPDASGSAGWLAAGLAAFITLTSPEAALRSLVPMADAAAQALSLLTLLCLVRARQNDSLPWSVLGGASLALACFVRHPQIFLALAALPLLLDGGLPARRRWRHLLAFGATALSCATPDLVYRTVTFGSPLALESPEWSLISLRNVAPTFLAVLGDGLFRRAEFAYLAPLVIYGAYRQCRQQSERPWAMMMFLSFGGVLLFHLCYSALRLRDLISLFPWLGIWAGRGIAGLWAHASKDRLSPTLGRIGAMVLILAALCARTGKTLAMPWYPKVWTFGYVTQAERANYDRLAATLPADAVVGTGLNSGAVERYTGHETVRPSSWSDQEFVRFVRALALEGRPIYLLDDGEEMEQFLPRVRVEWNLRLMGELDLPVFGLGGQHWERPAVLYVLE